MNFLIVFLGGGLGSLCRYALSLWLPNQAGIFPCATFLANIVSCFIFGVSVGSFTQTQISEQQKLLLTTGFCGGFSTFSSFSNDTFLLFQHGSFGLAMLNICANVCLCLFSLFCGLKLGGGL